VGPPPRPPGSPRRASRARARPRAVLARRQPPALLARLLAGCDIEALDGQQARSVGSLAARAGTTDIVDACVVEGALRRRDLVISSDPGDLAAIAAAISHHLEIDHP
jgi:hypothetical protein